MPKYENRIKEECEHVGGCWLLEGFGALLKNLYLKAVLMQHGKFLTSSVGALNVGYEERHD